MFTLLTYLSAVLFAVHSDCFALLLSNMVLPILLTIRVRPL